MDGYLSSEELLIKARKPYTITKQRERWTEEEHNRFLEALKLHGRAWQRIEEHIGTKTAVQIRSHAQKFFSKLEKEALVKGVSVGQSIDIEIPPPRPKRKPSNPYPRKTGSGCSPNFQVKANDGNQSPSCSPHSEKQVLDFEKEPRSEKNGGDDEEQNPKGTSGGGRCAEVFPVFPDASSSLGTSSKEIPSKPTESAGKEVVPAKKTLANDERSESHVDNGPNVYHKPDKPDYTETVQNDSKNKMHAAAKSFPRHAPVQILDGSQATCSQGLSSDVSYQEPRVQKDFAGQSSMFGNPAVSMAVESPNSTSRSSNHNVYPPFNPLPSNEQDYSSFIQMSSTFSSMIVSALLQNPAAHAAACFSASLWPSSNMGNGFAPPAPSMEAIAAATIAAATAWWAAHGLLPCAPFHPALVPVPYGNVSQVCQSEQDHSEALLQRQHSVSNSENSGEKMDIEVAATNVEEAPSICEQKDVNKGSKKQVDRSSCGSNTPSGSDVETDALGKTDNGNEDANDPDVNNNAGELNGRRLRFVGNITDNWKEVSEEGRLAFKALFSKGRLPQSFLPSHNFTSKLQNTGEGNEEASQFDLNRKAWETVFSDQSNEKAAAIDQGNNIDGELRIGLSQTSSRTGFKPYKRCSVESRENTLTNSGNSEQGNCSKRIRLEGEASI